MWFIGCMVFWLLEYLATIKIHSQGQIQMQNTQATSLSADEARVAALCLLFFFALVPTYHQFALTLCILTNLVVRTPEAVEALQTKGVFVRQDLQRSTAPIEPRNRRIYGWGRSSLFWDWVFNTLHPNADKLSWTAFASSASPVLSSFTVYSNLSEPLK